MKLLCLIGIHKWSSWEYIGDIGRYEQKLKSTCDRCGKPKIYIGITDQDIETRKLSPYKYKH